MEDFISNVYANCIQDKVNNVWWPLAIAAVGAIFGLIALIRARGPALLILFVILLLAFGGAFVFFFGKFWFLEGGNSVSTEALDNSPTVPLFAYFFFGITALEVISGLITKKPTHFLYAIFFVVSGLATMMWFPTTPENPDAATAVAEAPGADTGQ